MRKSVIYGILAGIAMMAAGCNHPTVGNAGYVIMNHADSRATCVIGSNNTQANAVHSPIGGETGGEAAEADGLAQKAYASGLFVNNSVGSRSADLDATTSLEKLNKVSDSTVGQSTGRDSSPVTSEGTTTSNREKTVSVSVPVSASQNGNANSSTNSSAETNEGGGGSQNSGTRAGETKSDSAAGADGGSAAQAESATGADGGSENQAE